jgi:hypothetical protein
MVVVLTRYDMSRLYSPVSFSVVCTNLRYDVAKKHMVQIHKTRQSDPMEYCKSSFTRGMF